MTSPRTGGFLLPVRVESMDYPMAETGLSSLSSVFSESINLNHMLPCGV